MCEETRDNLTIRIERLEQENRRLKLGGLAILALIGAAVLMGQAKSPAVLEEVRTRNLVVVNAAGEERAALDATEDGMELSLRDETGKDRVAVMASKSGGTIFLYSDNAKEPRVLIDADKTGASLGLMDRIGKGRLVPSTDKDGPKLMLVDEKEHPRAAVSVSKDGPNLMLSDAEGYQLDLGALPIGAPKIGTKVKRSAASLVMFDTDGRVIWQAP